MLFDVASQWATRTLDQDHLRDLGVLPPCRRRVCGRWVSLQRWEPEPEPASIPDPTDYVVTMMKDGRRVEVAARCLTEGWVSRVEWGSTTTNRQSHRGRRFAVGGVLRAVAAAQSKGWQIVGVAHEGEGGTR